MGISTERLKHAIDALAKVEPRFSQVISEIGYPEARLRDRGYETLLRTIVGQQISVKAAASVWTKLEAGLGDLTNPVALAEVSDEAFRACGLSRQKAGYARSLAEEVASGRLDLGNLPVDDEAAIAALVSVKGIGRWSGEVYLLFAEGREDIWPAGDLAVQIAIGRIMGLEERPSEKATREMAEAWRPYRGAAAIFAWHHYNTTVF